MKLYSPLGNQDFMWFARYKDGGVVTEFDDQINKVDFLKVPKEDVEEYGIVGLGAKLSYNFTKHTFKILHHEVEILLDGERLQGHLLTNPYKTSVSTAILGESEYHEKVRKYYDTTTNITGFEFGTAGQNEKVQFINILKLISGEKMYFDISLRGQLGKVLTIKVNGRNRLEHVIKEDEQEINIAWTFRED